MIDSVTVNGVLASYERIGIGPDQILRVDLGGTIPAQDSFRLGVSYYGRPDAGIYYSSYNDGLTYVMNIPWLWTDFPVGARYWFPGKDAFYDKATVELWITVPSTYEVVASGRLKSIDTIGGNWRYHWVSSYQIPTWYIVFAVSDYVIVRDSFLYGDSTMPIMHWVKHADSINALTAFYNVPDMLHFFSDLFGHRYPFFEEKFGFVKLPNIGWAMENQTNVFWAIPIPPSHHFELIVAHEIAHQWWGCAVTPNSIREIWLSEGFATYCEALYSDHWVGGVSYHDYMAYLMIYYMNNGSRALGHPFPMYDPPDGAVWTTTIYEKGASVLHMLRRIVGDTLFFEILASFYGTHKYSSATTSDFLAVAESVSGQDLDWFFEQWVYKAGYPEYEYSFSWDSLSPDSFRVNLLIEQVQSQDWNVPIFKMPIDIEIYSSTGDTALFVVWNSLESQSFTLFVDSKPEGLRFDPGNWVLKRATFVGIEEEEDYELGIRNYELTAYPNPSRGKTVISYRLSVIGKNSDPITDYLSPITISIYDLTGRLIRTLPITDHRSPITELTWDGRDNQGKEVQNGLYFTKSEIGSFVQTTKVILIR